MLLYKKEWPKGEIYSDPKWEEYIEKRKITSFSRLPKKIRDSISNLINKAPEFGIEEIYLIGSYVEGHWVNNRSPKEFLEYRRKRFGKKLDSRSDIDLVVHPFIQLDGFHVWPKTVLNTRPYLTLYDSRPE